MPGTILDAAGQPLSDAAGQPLFDTSGEVLNMAPAQQTDIALVWDNATGSGDWAMLGADLQSGSDLESAILVSLFTNRRAPNDFTAPPPSPDDWQGWWCDSYNGFEIGSWIWLYERSVKTTQTLNLVRQAARDALAWLVDLGAVQSFDVTAQWVNRTMVGLSITAHMPTGAAQNLRYLWLWGA